MKVYQMAVMVVMLLAGCGGAIGPPGAEGPIGPAGPKGDSATGLTEQMFCFGSQIFGGSTAAIFEYVRYDFADGSSFVSCYLLATNDPNYPARIDSIPLFYKNTDLGAPSGDCEIAHDMGANGSGSGNFVFTVSSSSQHGFVKYTNPYDGYDGTLSTLTCLNHLPTTPIP